MHTYHMILNSGDNNGSFYYGVTQHALQHEAFCWLSPLLRFICWFLMSVCVYVVQEFKLLYALHRFKIISQTI